MADDKPISNQITPAEKPEKATVEEHPISEADAKKYAGQGDYSLPVSPLDELMVPAEGTAAKEQKEQADKPAVQPQPGTGAPLPSTILTKPEAMKPETPAAKTDVVPAAPPKPLVTPTKPDTAKPISPPPPPKEVGRQKVDLEKKAKEMLKEIDKPGVRNGNDKPKMKRGNGAMKMALAAVLVVLMGAGGVVGVNLLKMQQSAENRSQASGTCNAPLFCRSGQANDSCVGIAGKHGIITQDNMCCVLVDDTSRQCDEPNYYCVSSCAPMGGGGGGGGDSGYSGSCSSTGCNTNGDGQCYVNYYHSPKRDTQNVWVSNCDVNPTEGDVTTLVCRGTQAELNQDCGADQIDLVCGGSTISNASRRYDRDCGGSTPPPESPPPETPLSCVSLLPANLPALGPGGQDSVTVTLTANKPVTWFRIAFYNVDNQYPYQEGNPPSNPRGYEKTAGSIYTKDVSLTTAATSQTFTITYDDINDPDLQADWAQKGSVPTHFSISGFVGGGGESTHSTATCIQPLNAAVAETLSCTNLAHTVVTGGPNAKSGTVAIGDEVNFTCNPGDEGATYDFRYKVDGDANWLTFEGRGDRGTQNTQRITIKRFGTYTVQCRICKNGTCDPNWEPAQ